MHGVWTALVTPFDSNHQLDVAAFRKLLNRQKEAGVDGVIPCGTTGESPTLTLEEKKKLISLTVEEFESASIKVVAGTGDNDTSRSIEFSKWASKAGVDGVLLVTPYYNRPSQRGLESHFLKIADSVDCEIMLYNVPSRTQVSLAPETVCRLADHPQITSLKEATGNVALTSEIIDHLRRAGKRLDILSGDDATFLPLLAIGAVGTVSVASNLFPKEMVAIQTATEAGQMQIARDLHQLYYPLFRDLFIESNPVPIKQALAEMGLCQPHVRLPLVPLGETSLKRIQESLTLCGFKKGTLI